MTHVITKTCKVCGEPKPLSAFLQMPGAKGGIIYGDICADCRKAKLEQLRQNEREDSTRTSSGFKIDANAKMADDAAKADVQQEVDLQYHEERDVSEEKQLAKEEKNQQIAQKERDHREHLEEKSASKETSQTHEKPEKSETPTAVEQQQAAIREGRVDLKVAVVDAGQAKVAYQSAEFLNFKRWLGADSFLVSQAERAAIRNAGAQPTKGVEAAKIAESSKTSESPKVPEAEKTTASSSNERKIENSTTSPNMFQEATPKAPPVNLQQTQTSQIIPPGKMGNLFSSIKQTLPQFKADPIKYAQQSTSQPPPSPTTTKRGPKR